MIFSILFLLSTTVIPIAIVVNDNNSCSEVRISNVSKYTWNSHDDKMLEYSKIRCETLYKNSPCLKSFEKYDKQDYRALCGK